MTFQSHLGLYVDIVLGTYFTIAIGEYVVALYRWYKRGKRNGFH